MRKREMELLKLQVDYALVRAAQPSNTQGTQTEGEYQLIPSSSLEFPQNPFKRKVQQQQQTQKIDVQKKEDEIMTIEEEIQLQEKELQEIELQESQRHASQGEARQASEGHMSEGESRQTSEGHMSEGEARQASEGHMSEEEARQASEGHMSEGEERQASGGQMSVGEESQRQANEGQASEGQATEGHVSEGQASRGQAIESTGEEVSQQASVSRPVGMLGLRQLHTTETAKRAMKSSRPYTEREDRLILEFAKKNTKLGGKEVWKNLEASGLLPGRTFESLRTRFLKQLKN